jgi:hypothetical protein
MTIDNRLQIVLMILFLCSVALSIAIPFRRENLTPFGCVLLSLLMLLVTHRSHLLGLPVRMSILLTNLRTWYPFSDRSVAVTNRLPGLIVIT